MGKTKRRRSSGARATSVSKPAQKRVPPTRAPWISGLEDAIQAFAMIRGSGIPTRNRIAYVLLDSTLEIAARQYLKYVKDITLDHPNHRRRDVLVKMLRDKLQLDDEIWQHLSWFYDQRNPMYHEEANQTIPDGVLTDFLQLFSFLLEAMFDINVEEVLARPLPTNRSAPAGVRLTVDPKQLKTKTDALVWVVGTNAIHGADEALAALGRLGWGGKITKQVINATFAGRPYFYREDETGIVKLSEAGKIKMARVASSS